MYTVRISHIPTLGKGGQLLKALEEHSKASNAAGGSYSVSQRMYAPQGEYVNSIRFEDLESLEAYNASAPKDQARMARLAKVVECLAQPQTPLLYETIVPAHPTGEVKYTLRVVYQPSIGKGAEMRQVLEEGVSRYPDVPGTVAGALSSQFVAEEANYVVTIGFSKLSGIEEMATTLRGDASFGTYQAKLAGLVSTRPRQELFRVTMPFPA